MRWSRRRTRTTTARGNISAEAVAIVGVGVAVLAVLTPLLLALGGRMDRIEARIDALSGDVAEVRRATCTPLPNAWRASRER